MLKYVSKFAMDILPSVVATILGAYIVNHYIATKPGADAPVAAAVSSADPKKAAVKTGAKPSDISADVGNIPERGVKAKGISEKAILEKTAAEKPAAAEKPQEKSQEKSADKPAGDREHSRRHTPSPAGSAREGHCQVRTGAGLAAHTGGSGCTCDCRPKHRAAG